MPKNENDYVYLPEELLIKILSFLDNPDLLEAACVNKSWYYSIMKTAKLEVESGKSKSLIESRAELYVESTFFKNGLSIPRIIPDPVANARKLHICTADQTTQRRILRSIAKTAALNIRQEAIRVILDELHRDWQTLRAILLGAGALLRGPLWAKI